MYFSPLYLSSKGLYYTFNTSGFGVFVTLGLLKLNNRTFQDIFQSYFHSKYRLDDFFNTKLIISNNFFEKNVNGHIFYSYKNDKKEFTSESKKLHAYHNFLHDILFQDLFVNNCVGSYKKNSNIYDIVSLHKNSKYYFKTDIKSFFHSIDKNLILNCLMNNLSNFPNTSKSNILNILEMITYNNSLPIGFITSPSISNAIMYEFDNFMEIYSKENDIIYTRYSDDLIFSTNCKDSLKSIESLINTKLMEFYNNKFILNQEKTRFLDKTKRIKLLGLIITPDGHITVDKQKKENIKHLLYFYKNNKDKFEELLQKKYDGKLSKAYGFLNYISDIDKSFIVYLRKKYGNFIIDKFLHGTK